MKMPTAKKLPSGKWRAQIMVDGQRISVTAETEKEAIAQAVSIKAGMMEKQVKPKALTLDEAILEYESIRENVLSPATIRGYEIVRKNRFKDLMGKDIHKITKRDIQKAMDTETALASPKTIANAYGLIRSVLKDYDIDVFGVKLPQKIRQKKTYLSTADIAKFIDAARGDDCEIPMVMAVWLGLRRSEIIGLCWDCVGFREQHNRNKKDNGAEQKESIRTKGRCKERRLSTHHKMPILYHG